MWMDLPSARRAGRGRRGQPAVVRFIHGVDGHVIRAHQPHQQPGGAEHDLAAVRVIQLRDDVIKPADAFAAVDDALGIIIFNFRVALVDGGDLLQPLAQVGFALQPFLAALQQLIAQVAGGDADHKQLHDP